VNKSIFSNSFVSFAVITAIGFAITLLLTAIIKNPLLAFVAFGIAIFAGMKITGTDFREFVKKYGWVIVVSALAALFVTSKIKPVVFAMLLLLHAATSFLFRSMKNQSRISFELTMLITVLASFAYGPKVGAVLGAASMLMDYAFSMRFSYFMPVTITSYALIGFFAGSFSGFGIAAVGIAASVIYNLVTSVIIIFFMGGHPEKCITFGLTDIVLNSVFFTVFSPWLLSITTT
jgi:hypothetical protein